ncbi:hypothetical protein BC834DRAFT_36901 [Gloeopeniophorella convolvens]|nr:hypothetical protein BC834DRAFT_36901 [Gloeopeniophorella convolvens]
MGSLSSESPEDLRRAIDGELRSLEESTLALKFRRNGLAPISRLPPETIATIFFFLPLVSNSDNFSGKRTPLPWLRVAHVCHRWREIALSQPRFWSHINFASVSIDGMSEILSRAKKAPLHLDAVLNHDQQRANHFREALKAHISHTCRLSITADFGELQRTVGTLESSAPVLEWLSLSNAHMFRAQHTATRDPLGPAVTIPDILFDGTAPKLSRLELSSCDISWTSPLLKGLRYLEILTMSRAARPSLEDWLNALESMPQLEMLVLHSATPIAQRIDCQVPQPQRTVTLPSLNRFDLSAPAVECSLALAHLVLPAVTWFRVDAESEHIEGDDVRVTIPYFVRNAHGPHDKAPLQSIVLSGDRSRSDVLLWTEPDMDVEIDDPLTLVEATLSARAVFTTSGRRWKSGTDTAIFGELLTALPTEGLVTLTGQKLARRSNILWESHASRWSLLKRVRLDSWAVTGFMTALTQLAPPEGPLFPAMTTLILLGCQMTVRQTYRLRDALIERVEEDVPIATLDLCGCEATERALQLLGEVVVDVLPPPELVQPSPFIGELAAPWSDWNEEVVSSDEDDEDEEEYDQILPWLFGGFGGDDDFEDEEDEDDLDDEFGEEQLDEEDAWEDDLETTHNIMMEMMPHIFPPPPPPLGGLD